MLLVYILRPMLATLVYMKINNGNRDFMAIKQPKKKFYPHDLQTLVWQLQKKNDFLLLQTQC